MSRDEAGDGEIEDCPELTDNYFSEIGQSFTVVDVWDDNEDELAVKQEPVNKQKDPPKADKNSRSSNEARKTPNKRSRTPERNKSFNKRSKSPERNRTRRSPFRFDRRRFSPSPPARANRDRNNEPSSAGVQFLKELQETFAKEGKAAPEIDNMLQQRNQNNNKNMHRQGRFNNNRQRQQGMNMMAQQQQQQHYNSMMMNMQQQQQMMMLPGAYPPQMMQTDPFIQFDAYGNNMMTQQPPLPQVHMPQPVPPPVVAAQHSTLQINPPAPVTSATQFDLTSYESSNISNQPPPPGSFSAKEVRNPAATKKPHVENARINLTDLLRKKQQNNKSDASSPAANAFTKKAEVLKQCKSASNAISEFEKLKNRVGGLNCVLSHERLPPTTSRQEHLNKSPLIVNDNNVQFGFQATPEQCRKAVECNPIRNISSNSILPLTHALGMDPLDVSLKVAYEAKNMAPEQEPPSFPPPPTTTTTLTRVIPPPPPTTRAISQPFQQPMVATNVTKKKNVNKGMQTEHFPCPDCERQERKKCEAMSASVQTVKMSVSETGTQCQEEQDSFSFTIDAKTLQERTFEQHHALEVFVKAFKLENCKFLDSSPKNHANSERSFRQKELAQSKIHEDPLLTFTNPENPHPENPHQFVSLSPLREPARPVSPHRRTNIFNRVGEKIYEPPPRKNPSPLNFNVNPYRIPSPQVGRFRGSRSPGPSSRYRNRSRSRSHTPHSRSPRIPSRHRTRSPLHSRSRSPRLHVRNRSRSPFHSRSRSPRLHSRNRSRSRSPRLHSRNRSRSPVYADRNYSRSPPREYYSQRHPQHYGLNDRRGRF